MRRGFYLLVLLMAAALVFGRPGFQVISRFPKLDRQITEPVITAEVGFPSPKPEVGNLFHPLIPTLEQVFRNDHTWVATLSAKRLRVLVATGDVLLARSVNFQAVRRQDFTWPFAKTAFVLKNADLTLINLESPLVPGCSPTNKGMRFCGDERHLRGLVSAGVDVASLANNHLGDYGPAGIKNTTQLLERGGILTAGTSGPVYQEIRGLRFAFLGYNGIGYQEPGITWADQKLIESEVKQAKEQAEVVIVSFHWGTEYTSQPTAQQRRLARTAIDAGADLIIGNHPHWIQPIEFYRNKAISYAHGNFVFDQKWSLKTSQGVVGRYVFFDDTLIDIEFLPVEIVDYGQPHFLEGEQKRIVLKELERESRRLTGR